MKDRIAKVSKSFSPLLLVLTMYQRMVEHAEHTGVLVPGKSVVIEPTSESNSTEARLRSG